MSWFAALPFVEFIVKEVSGWSQRRDILKQAKLDGQVAELKAKAEIAAYKVKADIEWDLKWADQASTSWKDEYLLIIWSVPLIGLFVPFMRPYIMEGFDYLKVFNPDAANWYMAGFAIIFSAVFGMKAATALMLPGQTGRLAGILSSIPDDIPDGAAERAQAAINAALKGGKPA